MVCPKCNAQLPPGAIMCGKCGTKFKTKTCPHCKSPILFSATTCPRCGKAVTQSAQPAQTTYPQYTVPNNSGGFRWWYILIGVGIFILGAAIGAIGMRQYIISNVQSAFNQFSNFAGNSSQATPPPQKESSQPASEASPQSDGQSAVQTPQGADAGALGDYEVTILEARSAVDYEGKPAIIVGYKFTNNSDENQMFMVAISDKAFQNGSQLETAIISSSDESYNSQNSMKEVQPGGTLEVEQAYLLQDETNEVTIEVTELFSLSKSEKLTKTFTPSR